MVNGDNRRGAIALSLVAIFLVAMNMRGEITGVGPLIPQISETTGYPETVLGTLSSIPMFMWAIGSPFVHALTIRFGLDRTMIVALVALGLASVLRGVALPAELGLWAGTVIIGLSLAVINVLMPVATRRDFGPRASAIMSVNTNMLVIWAAAMSGLAVPISEIPVGGGVLGWRLALMCTGVLVPFAIIVWLAAHGARGPVPQPVAVAPRIASAPSAGEPSAEESGAEESGAAADPGIPARRSSVARRVWGDGLAWMIAWYMGLQAVQFFIVSSWLPKMEVARGVSDTMGGIEIMVMQLAGMVATLLLPLAQRTALRRRLPGWFVLPGIVAALGIILFPDLTLLWVIVLGLASGPCLAIPLILIGERSRDGATATALSGMVQGFGYGVSGFGPIIFGWLHTVSGDWQIPMWFTLADLVALAVVGFAIHPARFVLESRRERSGTGTMAASAGD